MILIPKQVSHYRLNLPITRSPTYFNLDRYLKIAGWQHTRFPRLAHLNEINFDFDASTAETLEFKHCLAALIARAQPQIMPDTYRINDHNWHRVLSQIDSDSNQIWILKPALQNNGQNIKIFNETRQLEHHYLDAKRLGGEHVLQRYITAPHLIDGKKYSIRLFVVLSNDCGVYLYPNGYFNISNYPYNPNDFTDLRNHLTNEHLKESESNVTQVPTQDFDNLFPLLYQQIKPMISQVITALQQSHPQAFIAKKRRRLAIFGFDFMVDQSQRVWLLEANHGPCFPISDSHPMQAVLYYHFWQAFIASFILPIAQGQASDDVFYQLFERV